MSVGDTVGGNYIYIRLYSVQIRKGMCLTWLQLCALVHAFAIAQNGYVSIDEEKQQVLLYKSGNVVFQLPRLIVMPAKLNQGAWS